MEIKDQNLIFFELNEDTMYQNNLGTIIITKIQEVAKF